MTCKNLLSFFQNLNSPVYFGKFFFKMIPKTGFTRFQPQTYKAEIKMKLLITVFLKKKKKKDIALVLLGPD